jgi:hypothetical protein
VGLAILSSSAMATAGYMWPPVPPAAKATRRVLAASLWVVGICSFACCLMERQQRSLGDLQWKQIDQKLPECVCVCVRERELAWVGA